MFVGKIAGWKFSSTGRGGESLDFTKKKRLNPWRGESPCSKGEEKVGLQGVNNFAKKKEEWASSCPAHLGEDALRGEGHLMTAKPVRNSVLTSRSQRKKRVKSQGGCSASGQE